eukprot:Nitzschia sp. Nitz4//scaffold94_size78252//6564//7331//NITZ4_005456-RA/size78252-processed-gene-0.1-mRNA-1//1//CDS//3329560344//97//frame0
MDNQAFHQTTQQLVALINTGAGRLRNQQYEEAIGYFQQTLEATQRLLSQSQHASVLTDLDSCPCRGYSTPRVAMTFLYTPPAATSSPSASAGDCSSKFVFEGPLQIDRIDNAFHNSRSLFVVLSSVALVALYNLGLSNHLSGLDQQCELRLKKAIKYYQSAYALQLQDAVREACTSLLPVMAILNNMGMIFLILDKPVDSQKFLGRLLVAMTGLREIRYEGLVNVHCHEMKTSLEGFWGNVTRLILRDPSTAPAA